jgi:hypothetical protein
LDKESKLTKFHGLPQVEIGDIIIVKHKINSKVFELEDIACWEKHHSIKTIGMVEKKFNSWSYETKQELKQAVKDCKERAKFIIKDKDMILIQCKHDSIPYNVGVWCGNSYNADEMTSVSFQKLMVT